MNDFPVIGITGGIGSGKSSIAKALESLGAVVIDSDKLAHAELETPDVVKAIKARWGNKVCHADGRIDRRSLGAIVFKDAVELQWLEDLLYPRIHERRRAIIDELKSRRGVKAVVLDAPKLHEAGVDKECDAVLFVDADHDVRLQRVAQTRSWDAAELARREKMQIPLDKKKAMADYVVVNNHPGLDSLTPELQRILDSVVCSKP